MLSAIMFALLYLASAFAYAANVSLAWDQPTDSTIVGYTVHYGQGSGSYNAASNVGNVGTVTISGLADGTAYFFVVNDYAADGTTSAYSNEVSATTPSLGPSASFSANPSSGAAPLSVTFANLSTDATSYAWAFGDGGTSTAVSPTYVYQSPGSFTATLSATGPGGTAQAAAAISVAQVPPPAGDITPPVVAILSPADGQVLRGNGKVSISASATDDIGVTLSALWVDGAIVSSALSYQWNLKNVARGQHTISVTARDAAGNQATNTITVTRQ